MIRKGIIFLVLIAMQMSAYAQNPSGRMEATNMYVDYANESIHGILIVHRLLQNYNKDINKYVDLESTQLNFYSNSDLALDVFSSDSFFSPTPEEIYALASKKQGAPAGVVQSINAIRGICKELNQLRFDIETSIEDYDLNKPENLGRVYEQLKRGEDLYDTYYVHHKKLNDLVSQNSSKAYTQGLNKDLFTLYSQMRKILVALRAKKPAPSFQKELSSIMKAVANISQTTEIKTTKQKKYISKIVTSANKFVGIIKNYESAKPLPSEYKDYGKNYFYYNTEAITKFNWYGQGVVRDINMLCKELYGGEVQRLLEIPHYFRVVYPKRKEKIGKLATAEPKKNQNIAGIKGWKVVELPEEIKNRKVRKTDKVIKSSELELELEIYDHMIVDGDIISLSFNDVWIVEKELLQKAPIRRTIKLNTEGKNYILLHAENVGRRPPNTIAIRYKYFGSYKQVILNSDLNTSELIEIEYVR